MMNKNSNKFAGTGALTAIAASLCCITPVLALIAGSSGMASVFSWMEPFRPYLIGTTILVLAFAWYQTLKSRTTEEIQCDCETDEKPSFWQTKKFLGIVTVFALVMMAFPYYSSVFYPDNKKDVVIVNAADMIILDLEIEGMTCEACGSHVAHAAQKVDGVIDAFADHKTRKAKVKFDGSKASKETIISSINETGYKVVSNK